MPQEPVAVLLGKPIAPSPISQQSLHLDSLMLSALPVGPGSTAVVDAEFGGTRAVAAGGEEELIGVVGCSDTDARVDGGMLSERPHDTYANKTSSTDEELETDNDDMHYQNLDIVQGIELMDFDGDLLGAAVGGTLGNDGVLLGDAQSQPPEGGLNANNSLHDNAGPRAGGRVEQLAFLGMGASEGVEEMQTDVPVTIVLDDDGNVVDDSVGVPNDAFAAKPTSETPGSDGSWEGPLSPGTPQAVASPPETPAGLGKKRKGAPRMKRTQRCGHCHTCKNPKLKKACENKEVNGISSSVEPSSADSSPTKADAPPQPEASQPITVAAADEVMHNVGDTAAPTTDSDKSTVKPAKKRVCNRYTKVSLQSPSNQTAAPNQTGRPRADTRDMTAVLAPLLTPAGGMEDVEKFKQFQELFAKEDTLQMRFLLLAIMELTTHQGCLKQFVADGGLVTLNAWLTEARDSGVSLANEGRSTESQGMFSLANKIIATLKKLPVTLDSLSRSQIGKTVRSIVKSPAGNDVKGAAKTLVNLWKSMFISSPQAPAEAGEKRERAKESAGSSVAKKVNSEKARVEEKPGSSTGLALKTADDDMLFEPRKPTPRPKPPPIVIRRKVQRLETTGDEVVSPSSDGAAVGVDASSVRSPTGGEGTAAQDDVDLSDTVADETRDGTEHSSESKTSAEVGKDEECKQGSESTEVKNKNGAETAVVSAAPRLPVTIKITNINPYQRPSAAQRAAEAAARIPDDIYESESSLSKKVKSKTVSFKAVDECTVRIFRKDMPPQNACKDDTQGEEEEKSADPASPRLAFESAAKREHMSEREANEHVHELPTETDICALVDWEPPPEVLLDIEEAVVANGEGSLEAGLQSEREAKNMPSLYSAGLSRAYSPIEPAPLSSRREVEDQQKSVTVIPWTVITHTQPNVSSMAPPAGMQAQAPGKMAAPVPASSESPGASLMDIVSKLDPSLISHIQAMSHQAAPQGGQIPTSSQPAWSAGAPPEETPQNTWEYRHASGPGPSYAPPQAQYPPSSYPDASGNWSTTPVTSTNAPPPHVGFNGVTHNGSHPQSWRAGEHIPQRGAHMFESAGPAAWSSWRTEANEMERPRVGSPPRRHSPPAATASGRSSTSWDTRYSAGARAERGLSRRHERMAGTTWRDLRDMPAERERHKSGPPPPRGSAIPSTGATSAKPCLFFNTPKGCRNGASCRFAHVETGMRQNDLVAHITAISKRPAPPDTNFQPMNRRRLDW